MEKNKYHYLLYRYTKVSGFEEGLVRATYVPAKMNGFGVILSEHSKLYEKKYGNPSELPL